MKDLTRRTEITLTVDELREVVEEKYNLDLIGERKNFWAVASEKNQHQNDVGTVTFHWVMGEEADTK